jgi:hypothetical protein
VKFREPPKLATRMLQTFSCHADDEAILGDLQERYQKRPSSAWYWRQAFIAIFNSFAREAWGHKRDSARALCVGWFSLFAIWIALEALTAEPFALNRHVCTFFWCIAGTGSGLLVGTIGKGRPRPMIFLYAASVAVFLLVFHGPPKSKATFYWIDTTVLTISILLAALPHAVHAVTHAQENL